VSFAETFSVLGKEKAKRNAWSGGSYKITEATIVDIDTERMSLDVVVETRNERKDDNKPPQRVDISLDAKPVIKVRIGGCSKEIMEQYVSNPVPRTIVAASDLDDIVRRLCRFCWIVNQPAVTGRLIQLGIQLQQDPREDHNGSSTVVGGVGKIKENLYLNQVPHNRYVRQYFYEMAAKQVLEAVVLCAQQPDVISNRMQVISLFPETNPSMDSYRIGTLLELTRAIAIKLVEQNLRVRICVQGSMGVGIFTGLPKQLGGVAKLLQLMDWQSNDGEENEGMVGTYLNFGAVGADHVVNKHTRTNEDGTTTQIEQDDVFLIIAPQNMVGTDSSIIPKLQEMVDAAGDRPVVLINPDLSDKVSSQGQQNVRGRQQRMDFADSFQTVWQFQNIYVSGTSYFPILGSIFKPGPQSMWIAHQRRDLLNSEGEIYVPVLAGEHKPTGEQILDAFES
jgi:adenylate kinase